MEGHADIGVPGVEIAAYRRGVATPVTAALSDQAGYYHVKALETGEYLLAIPRAPQRTFVADGGVEIVVAGGQQSEGPLFRAAPPVSVSGQVLVDAGAPVAEANITLALDAGGPQPTPAVYGSDTEGRFQIDGLCATDQVRLRAGKLGSQSNEFGPVMIGPGGLKEILLRMSPP
ncbi:MAG: carboxypeptidase-like regulatory domain-containing protein, partial [Gammaproteobacteria bacterium]|nr:carboxypeptidase-like regulatory domain-containing protein [Gammaproteobacteria bacterium]